MVDASVAIDNLTDEPRELSVVVWRGEPGSDPVFEWEETQSTGRVNAVEDSSTAFGQPGRHTVRAMPAAGEGTTRTVDLPAGFDGYVDVLVREGGVGLWIAERCSPDCPGAGTDAMATDLPYAAPNRPKTYRTSTGRIENPTDHSVDLDLRVTHGDDRVLAATYRLPANGRVILPDLTATAGEYDVRADVAGGGTERSLWSVPPDHAYPELHVRVDPGGDPVVGCRETGGTGSVSLRNDDAVERDVAVRLERDGQTVASDERSIPAGADSEFAYEFPVGDREWAVEIPPKADSAPAVADGLVYVAADAGVSAVTTDGDPRWRTTCSRPRFTDPSKSSPAVADGRVYVGCQDGALYALDGA